MDNAYSLVITGAGAGPIAQDYKLVRDPGQIATLLDAFRQPTVQVARKPRYQGDLQNEIRLIWRTLDTPGIVLTYDPAVGVVSHYDGLQETHYAVPPAFAALLRGTLCAP